MSVAKMKDGRWYCSFYYKDAFGEQKRKKKEGFKTKREAQRYENEQKELHSGSCDMTFENMFSLYIKSVSARMKESTVYTKNQIAQLKILPYFGKTRMTDITPRMIHEWQTQMIEKGYKPTYLRTINNIFAAVFSFAEQYYGLKSNPCRRGDRMGKRDADTMKFWTVDQFENVICNVHSKPCRMALTLMFWTGIRKGECLALTVGDFDFQSHIMSIDKTLGYFGDKVTITPPKTARSIRKVFLPEKLCDELQDYIAHIYKPEKSDRLFPMHPANLNNLLSRACKRVGVDPIRVHDLRHSHASMLIDLGFSPLLVSERLGHESIDTTLRIYSHLYPNKQEDAADRLNEIMVRK